MSSPKSKTSNSSLSKSDLNPSNQTQAIKLNSSKHLTHVSTVSSTPTMKEKPRVPMTTLPMVPVAGSTSTSAPNKNHKVEGKNKKSLHRKQQQANCQQQRSKDKLNQKTEQQSKNVSSTSSSSSSPSVEKRAFQKSTNGVVKQSTSTSSISGSTLEDDKQVVNCVTLEDYSQRAQLLKGDIKNSLEKQAEHHNTDQPPEVVKLKDDILKLSGLKDDENKEDKPCESETSIKVPELTDSPETPRNNDENVNLAPNSDKPRDSMIIETTNKDKSLNVDNNEKSTVDLSTCSSTPTNTSDINSKSELPIKNSQMGETTKDTKQLEGLETSHTVLDTNQGESGDVKTEIKCSSDCNVYKSDKILSKALDNLKLIDNSNKQNNCVKEVLKQPKKQSTSSSCQRTQTNTIQEDHEKKINAYCKFEPSNPRLCVSEVCKQKRDMVESAVFNINLETVLLQSKREIDNGLADTCLPVILRQLRPFLIGEPHILRSLIMRIVKMKDDNAELTENCEKYQAENQKLLLVKQKLENLCRELQKSNNAIRIESLDLIKVEQSKAKEQTTKIQSTLSGVIKLFDENQHRNMSLRQENHDLQMKLKSLLDHCDNWEKSVEATLRQRDIENRLIKTELAKANLSMNEEKEKFLGEKQELLQILSMMQEQQHRIEGQEAKLRSDLSSYANKYDECQAVISKGMNRFQAETKRMLKQIEKSKQDYKVLLSKYETSNKRMAQLLEEKQYWDRAMSLANKKIETLEKLCRALRERKADEKNEIEKDNPSTAL